jgi:hypothetical protein
VEWALWLGPIIPATQKVRQEDHEFEAILGYTEEPILKSHIETPYKAEILRTCRQGLLPHLQHCTDVV